MVPQINGGTCQLCRGLDKAVQQASLSDGEQQAVQQAPQGLVLALPVLVGVEVGQKLCILARRWCAAPWACPPPPCSSRGLTALHASAWGSAQVGVGAGQAGWGDPGGSGWGSVEMGVRCLCL